MAECPARLPLPRDDPNSPFFRGGQELLRLPLPALEQFLFGPTQPLHGALLSSERLTIPALCRTLRACGCRPHPTQSRHDSAKYNPSLHPTSRLRWVRRYKLGQRRSSQAQPLCRTTSLHTVHTRHRAGRPAWLSARDMRSNRFDEPKGAWMMRSLLTAACMLIGTSAASAQETGDPRLGLEV